MNGHFRYFTLTGHIAGAVQSDAIDATRKRRRRHFAASLQTVPLLSWLRSQLNLISSGLIPTLNRIRPEEAMQREIEGAISMTKTIMVPGNPPVHQTLNTPINSIVAAAKTAHELESARRKATRDKGQIYRNIVRSQIQPYASFLRRELDC